MKPLLLVLTLLTLSLSAFGQQAVTKPNDSIVCDVCPTAEQIYPSRINNYFLSDLAVATASSTADSRFPPSSAIDGDRIGQYCPFAGNVSPCWEKQGGWNDATRDVWPDWLRVDMFRAHSVGRVVVASYQDLSGSPRIEPYLGYQQGFYGIEAFHIQILPPGLTGADDSDWVTVADVEENEDVIREFTFSPRLTSAVRIVITESYVHFSRVIEFEAYAN